MKKLTITGPKPALLMGVAALALSGCVDRKPAPTGMRLFQSDTVGGAKVCAVSKVATLTDGASAPVDMQVTNDGGWCPVTVMRDQGAFDAGLVSGRPAHGSVYIHTVGATTRIDYTPARGFSGPDQFGVTLLPGDTQLRVTVAVAPGVQPPPPAPVSVAPSPSTTRRRVVKKPTS